MEKVTSKEYNEGNRCGIKTITGKVYDAHLFYANNKGRGSDNLTVCIVKKGTQRARMSKNQTGIIKSYRTSAWHGLSRVNTSDID